MYMELKSHITTEYFSSIDGFSFYENLVDLYKNYQHDELYDNKNQLLEAALSDSLPNDKNNHDDTSLYMGSPLRLPDLIDPITATPEENHFAVSITEPLEEKYFGVSSLVALNLTNTESQSPLPPFVEMPDSFEKSVPCSESKTPVDLHISPSAAMLDSIEKFVPCSESKTPVDLHISPSAEMLDSIEKFVPFSEAPTSVTLNTSHCLSTTFTRMVSPRPEPDTFQSNASLSTVVTYYDSHNSTPSVLQSHTKPVHMKSLFHYPISARPIYKCNKNNAARIRRLCNSSMKSKKSIKPNSTPKPKYLKILPQPTTTRIIPPNKVVNRHFCQRNSYPMQYVYLQPPQPTFCLVPISVKYTPNNTGGTYYGHATGMQTKTKQESYSFKERQRFNSIVHLHPNTSSGYQPRVHSFVPQTHQCVYPHVITQNVYPQSNSSQYAYNKMNFHKTHSVQSTSNQQPPKLSHSVSSMIEPTSCSNFRPPGQLQSTTGFFRNVLPRDPPVLIRAPPMQSSPKSKTFSPDVLDKYFDDIESDVEMSSLFNSSFNEARYPNSKSEIEAIKNKLIKELLPDQTVQDYSNLGTINIIERDNNIMNERGSKLNETTKCLDKNLAKCRKGAYTKKEKSQGMVGLKERKKLVYRGDSHESHSEDDVSFGR